MNRFRSGKTLSLLLLAAALITGCGSNESAAEDDQPDAGLTSVKSYLSEHTADLVEQTDALRTAADAYYDLARSEAFNYRVLLRKECAAVDSALSDARNAFLKANPSYQEIKGIVSGLPRTAQYDTDIDAGSDASDPADAVSFNLKVRKGDVLKQPGNLFFLIETSLYGTNEKLVVKGVRPDVNCDGKISFGEGLPDAGLLKASAAEINKQARDLNQDAQEIVITPSDAFTAVTVMTPEIGEYFEQWKRSSFVAGEGEAGEEAFVATSRLSDIAGILAGIDFVYEEIEPLIAEKNADQAEQIAVELSNLLGTAEDLRDREAAGEKFTPREADQLGAEMQARAERIAIQVAQAARELDIEIQGD